MIRQGRFVVVRTLGWVLVIQSAGAASAMASQAGKGWGQPSDAMIAVPALAGSIVPTTDLTQAPWSKAARVTGFLSTEDGRMSEYPTWLCLFSDDASLWIAVRCEGRSDSEIQAKYTDRDGPIWRDDSVEVLIDATGSGNACHHFAVNSAGALYDARNQDGDWNGQVVVRASIDSRGWTAVVGIPFDTIGTQRPKPGETWKANVCRTVSLSDGSDGTPPVKVRSAWSRTPISYQRPEYFGRLVFGTPRTGPVRMTKLDAVSIGENRIGIDPVQGLECRLTGLDGDGASIWTERKNVQGNGELSCFIKDDRTRRVAVSLLDAGGTALLQGEYPMQSPEVARRLAALEELHRKMTEAADRFGPEARTAARNVLEASRPKLEQAAAIVADTRRYTAANWTTLARTVADLEYKLDGMRALSETIAIRPGAAFGVGLADSMQKVMIRDFPFDGVFADRYDLGLARYEHEGLQVVVMPFGRKLKNVGVTVSELKGLNGSSPFAGGRATVSLVGHVEVADDPPYKVDYHGWYPDPLLDFQARCDIEDGDHVAFWIDVATSADTPPGAYAGTIEVRADDCEPVTIRLDVTVWDFELPKLTHLRNAFTYHEGFVARLYGGRWNGELARKYHDCLLDHRLNIDHLYRANEPDVDLLEYGASRGMNAFNVGGGFRRIGKRADEDATRDAYVEQLKKAGVWDPAYVYGFDEIRDDEKFKEMRDTFDAVHRRYPDLETMTTAHDPTLGRKTATRGAVDIWVPLTDTYDLEEARKARADGKKVWWYVCVVPYPPYANWFVESAAIEARLLTGAMSYKYEVDGFLYYQMTKWTGNHRPIDTGPYTAWDPGSLINTKKHYTANGDGSLLCAGPDGPLSTIRLENIRDGFEDYEYLFALGELKSRVGGLPETTARKAFVEKANGLLAVPDSVVETTTQFATDHRILADYRRRLAEAILEGRELVLPTKRVTPR